MSGRPSEAANLAERIVAILEDRQGYAFGFDSIELIAEVLAPHCAVEKRRARAHRATISRLQAQIVTLKGHEMPTDPETG